MAVKLSDDFTEYLGRLLDTLGVQKVSTQDALTLHQLLVDDIKKMEKAREGLSHEWITLKSKGRLVLPTNLRTAIGAHTGTRFDAHLYPNQQTPRGILLLKEEW